MPTPSTPAGPSFRTVATGSTPSRPARATDALAASCRPSEKCGARGERELDPVIPQVLIHRLADRDRLHHVVGWAHGLARRLDGVAHRLRQVREQQPGGAADALALDLGDLDRTPGEVDDAASGGRVAQDRVGTVRHLHVAEAAPNRRAPSSPGGRAPRQPPTPPPHPVPTPSSPSMEPDRSGTGTGPAPPRPPSPRRAARAGPRARDGARAECAAPGATAPGGVPARHRPGRPAGPRASRDSAAPSRARGGRAGWRPPAGRT